MIHWSLRTLKTFCFALADPSYAIRIYFNYIYVTYILIKKIQQLSESYGFGIVLVSYIARTR